MEDTYQQGQSEPVQALEVAEASLEDIDLSIRGLATDLQKSDLVIESLLDEGDAAELLESLEHLMD